MPGGSMGHFLSDLALISFIIIRRRNKQTKYGAHQIVFTSIDSNWNQLSTERANLSIVY